MKLPIVIIVFAYSCSVSAQSIFQNLDFESADLPLISSGQFGGEVAISSALPGWNASLGTVGVTQVLQNNLTLGNASIDIFGPSWSSVNPGIIDGNCSVFVQSGGIPQGGSGSGGVNASLWQNGTVPGTAASLQFKAWADLSPSTAFSVSFAGNNLVPMVLGTGQSPSGQAYTMYGVNISPYEGQSGQLAFTADFNNAGPSWLLLDDITFSPLAVPEPSPFALTGMGGLLFSLYRRFVPKRP